jgi:hypothetical protein
MAATFYVATTGNDAGAGTVASPFWTIQKAISTVAAGDHGNTTWTDNIAYPVEPRRAAQPQSVVATGACA